jgi:hypothetical protein
VNLAKGPVGNINGAQLGNSAKFSWEVGLKVKRMA